MGWGICTICTSTVKSYKALYAIRFLVGLFEFAFPVEIPFFKTNSHQIWLLPWHPLSPRIMVHTPRNRQTSNDLLARRSNRNALQRIPSSSRVHKSRRCSRARRLALALHRRWDHYATFGCNGVFLLPQSPTEWKTHMVDNTG